ncbi:MAG: NADPH-dependent F420 reductase [Pseudorhizobium sp.]
MKVVILGKGNMGAPLCVLARKAGHQVECFDSRTSPVAALQEADIVVIAMKYEQALALAENQAILSALAGKIVVDITNPLSPDFMSLTVGHTSSAAEEIAGRMPGIHVVKAFNTIFAALLQRRADGHSVDIPVYVAGDQEASVQTVADFVKSMGLNVVLSGQLSNARYLEPMAELMIQLGYGLDHGDQIGFALKNEAA